MRDRVYKILTEDEWNRFQATGEFSGSADDIRDGFIHLSTRDQIGDVIGRFFADRGPLHVVEFLAAGFPEGLKWEKLNSDETYPHFHGKTLFSNKVTAHARVLFQADHKTTVQDALRAAFSRSPDSRADRKNRNTIMKEM